MRWHHCPICKTRRLFSEEKKQWKHKEKVLVHNDTCVSCGHTIVTEEPKESFWD